MPKDIPKSKYLKWIATMPDGDYKRDVIALEVERGHLLEGDVANMVVLDVEKKYQRLEKTIADNEQLRAVWARFMNRPDYLARALVRLDPALFYTYGFAFRTILRLKADLGPVLIPGGSRGNGQHDPSIYLDALPKLVRQDILELDRELTFREYLYVLSRDPRIGLEMIEEDKERAKTAYQRELLTDLHTYCQKLLAMSFPRFITDVEGSLFPSVHVRWWLDKMTNVNRVLNMGDTGTQKTSFATIAMDMLQAQRVLVLCTANARGHWARETGLYYGDGPDSKRVAIIQSSKDLNKVIGSSSPVVAIGYPNIARNGVVQALCEGGFDGLIWDEAHYAKHATGSNPAHRAEATVYLIEHLVLKALTALTATPWENSSLEFGVLAWALRPDAFPSIDIFRQSRSSNPRFLRELFDRHILEVELREIMDLPQITPKPWEDLFGARLIPMNNQHRQVYEFVRETRQIDLPPNQKIQRLILGAIHPPKLQPLYQWPDDIKPLFSDELLSSKLAWLKEQIEQKVLEGAKVVVATGIFVDGITMPSDENDHMWVGALLQKWFGLDSFLILDQRVSARIDSTGKSDRDRLIERWQSDPEKHLLVSMRTCPDSISLSVPALPGITKLFLTTISLPWIPWKQFQGRFWRKGLGVPMEFGVPVVQDTADENLLTLGQEKWGVQQLFRAQVPLTERELALINQKKDLRLLAEEARSSIQKINIIGAMMQGRGERDSQPYLADSYGFSTNAEIFARAFLDVQDCATSGHIARALIQQIPTLKEIGLNKSETIFDAGCGPLTMERFLNMPIFGVDFNPFMITLGRNVSPWKGRNADCGFLSQLPADWTHKFELTIASLVLDWTAPRDRDLILSELVRVTHPSGLIWLTFTEDIFTFELLARWKKALRRQGIAIIERLSNLMVAKDHKKDPFAFWSLLFSPQGCRYPISSSSPLRFRFEEDRVKIKRGGRDEDFDLTPIQQRMIQHQEFEIVSEKGERSSLDAIVETVAVEELDRLSRLSLQLLQGRKLNIKNSPNLDWKVWWRLHRLGLVDTNPESR